MPEIIQSPVRLSPVIVLLFALVISSSAQSGTTNELGGLMQNLRPANRAKAEAILLRALKLREAVSGPEHPETGALVNQLALMYRDLGDSVRAEALFERGLKILLKTKGPEHPEVAATMSQLATVYFGKTGKYREAEVMARRSLEIRERIFGLGHQVTATSCAQLMFIEMALGQWEFALPLARKHKTASEAALKHLFGVTSERQRLEYCSSHDPFSYLATLGSAPDLAEVLLRNKGVVLDSLVEDQLTAAASHDPKIKLVVDQLQGANRRLIQLQLEVPNDLRPEVLKRWQAERDTLEQQVEELHKSLARHVLGVGQARRALTITIADVQTTLPRDTVLLEFVCYSHYLGKYDFERRYGVILVGGSGLAFPQTKVGEPVWVPLGSAAALDQNLKMYGTVMREGRRGAESILRTLQAQLLEPIQKQLPAGTRTLIVAPDAELNFFNFATLLTKEGHFLVEDFTVKYVSSGRDLVFGGSGKVGGKKLVVFANPAFAEQPAPMGGTNSFHLGMLGMDRRDYRGLSLGPLPGTEQEARFLKASASRWQLDATDYLGTAATEAEVNALQSPFILHLATHGFFLPEVAQTNSRAVGLRMPGEERESVVLRNSMQRSGLALAGANLTMEAWKRGETPPSENDGVLTAQEVGSLNLKGTWLVVLSACDTGLGEAKAGEGVLGLRRGFVQAGAQNLLLTLWPIADKWSVDLMKAFYEKAMATGDAPQALAEVQRDFLIKLRAEKGPLLAARLAGPFVLTFQGTGAARGAKLNVEK